ncbi:MAG: T9SS type A sorting domain-containing protein [Firmicutes bacterium]|nr:T9SS type A sorting domain-containing protein [Bacillota bacterium]
MKTLKTLAAFILILSVSNIYAQPVTLDPTFGENGIIVIPGTTNITHLDFDMLSNLIVVGHTLGDAFNKYYLTIVKINADGIIDQNFGSNGIVHGPEYSLTAQLGLKITHDNKIFVTGNFYANQYGEYKRTFMQFNEDGSLDENFGENGEIILNFGAYTHAINLENDDFILFGGIDQSSLDPIIWKSNYYGEIDESFGENGKVYLTDDEAYKIRVNRIKILNDQSIIIAGYDYLDPEEYELAFCKLNPNGDFVTEFANNGIWKMNIYDDSAETGFKEYEYFNEVIEDNTANLILTGTVHLGGAPAFIFSFYPDGTINSNFGTNGVYYISNYGYISKILQNGSNYLIGALNDGIVSIKNNGTLDVGFNDSGIFTCENYYFYDMKLQSPYRLILGGGRPYDLYNSNFAIVRLNIPSDVSVKPYPYTNNAINIFPNPVKEILYFNKERKFEIIDIIGKIVLKSEKAIQSVNISHLKAGIYFIKFEDRQVKKFVKE